MVNSFEDHQAQGSRVRQEHTMSVVMVGGIDQVGMVLSALPGTLAFTLCIRQS